MILSILCYMYVPPSVELLEPTTSSFQTRTQDHQFSNQIDASCGNDSNSINASNISSSIPHSGGGGGCFLVAAAAAEAEIVTEQQQSYASNSRNSCRISSNSRPTVADLLA